MRRTWMIHPVRVRTTHPVAVFPRRVPSSESQGYVVTVRGVAGEAVRSALCDSELTIDGDRTLIHCPGGDQATLHGLFRRLQDLGLEVLEVRQVTGPRVAR